VARLHLFEIEDQAWCPAPLRDAATAYLEQVVRLSGQARLLVPKLREALEAAGTRHLVDLGAGGGGPLPILLEELREQGVHATATLTDLYPNRTRFARVAAESGGAIDFVAEPVDATAMPPELRGVRTLFNAFHHFRPGLARSILQAAVRDRSPIAIFELVGREPAAIVGILFSWIAVLLVMPTIRPVRVSWLLLTYLVPLIPVLVVWDGLVSCLRVYSPAELESLVAQLEDGDSFRWDIGRIRLGRAPGHATYLVGTPRR
jgi:hypothetical protein